MNKVILASRNEGKIREIGEILSKFGMVAVSRDDYGIDKFEVEETGETFEENSYIKAKAILDIAGVPTIADDSGLEVDCIGGRPGVYSARFAGPGCTPYDNNVKLLGLMKHIPEEMRGEGGFGYDPLFIPEGFSKTFGEMTADEKNSVSHRGRSLARLEEMLGE